MILLMVLPLLAVITLVHQKDSRQAAAAQPKPVSAVMPHLSHSFTFLGQWHYTPSQQAVQRLARKKIKTLPAEIAAVGSSLPAANTTYTLAEGFDPNGYEYYQNLGKKQYCQWSILNSCWCIRTSLVEDSPEVRPTAEYFSSAKQSYVKGPAGRYSYGGMCPMINGSLPPVVTASAP